MPGPRFNKLGKGTKIINNYFLDPVDNQDQLQEVNTDDIRDGARIYVASERKDYYYDKASTSWKLVPGQEDPVLDQNNRNKFVAVLENDLISLNEEGVASWLNNQDPAIEVLEDENLYLHVRPEKPFITEWQTTLANESVVYPASTLFLEHDLTIDWGDGTTDRIFGNEDFKLTHTYVEPGSYQVKALGYSPVFNTNSVSASKDKLKKIVSWGDFKFSTLRCEGATNLTSLPLGEIPDFSNASTMFSAFKGTGISQIPEKLFHKAVKTTNMAQTFQDCINVTTIPAGLFDQATKVTDVSATFQDCNINTTIPAGLFDFMPDLWTVAYTFKGNAIPEVPAGLFDYATNLKSTYFCFYENSLSALPAGFLDNNTLIEDATGMFGYNAIAAIPDGFFQFNTNMTSANLLFMNNNLGAIPAGLFNYTTKITDMSNAFSDNSLTEIPAGLFDYTPLVTKFNNTFEGNQITTIPAGLFKNNQEAVAFWSTFEGNQVVEIPSGLFDATAKVTDFYRTFGNNNLTGIPAGLFDNCPEVQNFTSVFWANDILEIPAGLFDFTTKVTNFYGAFHSNTQLTTAPLDLFEKTTLVEDFSRLFHGCSNLALQLDGSFFGNAINAKNFDSTFYNCMALTGSAPEYWNDATKTGTDCYYLCEKLTNYAAIPLEWK